MPSIFISYKRQDKDIVFPIVNEIKQKTGVDCWIDLEGIESGDQFQNVIIDAIDNADIVVFMLSKNFIAPYKDENGKIDLKKQTFTEKEVMYALNEGKRLIPLSIDGTTVNDCKWLKFNCSGLDCIIWKESEQKEKFIKNLITWLDIPLPLPGLGDGGPSPKPLSGYYTFFASIITIVMSILWTLISGEYYLNPSLSYFTTFISCVITIFALRSALASSKVTSKDHWLCISTLIVAFCFFTTYTCIALGLAFINIRMAETNLPTVFCSIITIIAIVLLFYKSKKGYYLLWISSSLFSIGGYYTLNLLWIPIAILTISFIMMGVFTIILNLKNSEGQSYWNSMK